MRRGLRHGRVDQAHRARDGKVVVAESVESESALQNLREIGVDYAQGFVIGAPKALEEIGSVSVADLLA